MRWTASFLLPNNMPYRVIIFRARRHLLRRAGGLLRTRAFESAHGMSKGLPKQRNVRTRALCATCWVIHVNCVTCVKCLLETMLAPKIQIKYKNSRSVICAAACACARVVIALRRAAGNQRRTTAYRRVSAFGMHSVLI